jgi:zinc protease
MINSFKTCSHWVIMLLCIFIVEHSTAQVNPADKMPVDPKVKIGKLSNGLTYYVRQNKKPEQKVEL